MYLDCYMKGYSVPVTFWQQLVPHLCPPDYDSGTPMGWLSGEHMNAWVELLIRYRTNNDPWTVAYTNTISVHPENQRFMIETDQHTIGTLDGSTRPYPSWSAVNWVFLPIHVAGNHWVTGVIDLPNSHFYVFDSLPNEGTMNLLRKQIQRWTPVVNSILQGRGCFNETRGPYNFQFSYNNGLGIQVPQQINYSDWIKTRLGISKEVRTPRYPSLVAPLTKVGDEAVHKELGDKMERAATTASSLEAEQDRDVNAQTRFVITSTQSIDPPLSRGYTLRSGEDCMKLIGIDEILYTTAIAKVQTVNEVRQLQALVDKKRVIVTESSIRRDLHLDDADGIDCLPTTNIFEEFARMGAKSTAWNEFSSSMASLIICLATNQKFNLSEYIFNAMVKHLDGGVKFLLYPRFLQVFINQQLEMGEDLDHPTDSTSIHIIDQPSSSSQPKKDKPSKKAQRQEAEVPQDEAEHEESVPTPSNDPQPSGEDSMQLTDLMVLCTKLQTQVLDLQKAKDAQAKEIASLQKRIQRRGLLGLKRLHGFLKVTAAQVHNENYAKCAAGGKITTV
ncbi:phospholipase-like protein [Tanacetum coccineum]